MAVANVYIGNNPNDGTGDPIRSAFDIVNSNFSTLNNYIYQGIFPTIVNQLGITSQSITCNTSVTAQTFTGSSLTVANATVTGNAIVDGYMSVYGRTTVGGDLYVTGNIFQGGTGTALSTQSIQASKIYLHVTSDGSPLVSDDYSDIGVVVNYYKGTSKNAFFGWANDSQAWEFYANGQVLTNPVSGGNVFVGNTYTQPATYGTLKIGDVHAVNTTPSTSYTTGSLVASGGIGAAGNVYTGAGFYGNLMLDGNGYIVSTTNNVNIKGNLNFSGNDGVYINGVGVLTGIGGGGGNITGSTHFLSSITVDGSITGTLATAAQPNITTLGTLLSLAINGDTTTHNLIPNAGSWSIGQSGQPYVNIWATNLNGTVATATQPYITSVGTLSALSVAGNIAAGAGIVTDGYYFANGVSVVSSINSSWLSANTIQAGQITTLQNNITAANATIAVLQSNVNTINANIGSFYTWANINFGTSNYGNAQMLANITPTINTINANVTAANAVIATHTTWLGNLQSNVTTHTTWLGNLQANVNTYSNVNVAAYLANGTGTIIPSSNTSVNLGSTTAWWNNIYGTAVHAQYADLAEMYTSDAEYPPGTVLIFGGDAEVTVTDIVGDTRVAGAVSTEPAYLMNSMIEGTSVAVALRGRVPVRVMGPVAKGDLLITSRHPGCAQSGGRTAVGAAVFAKAIQASDDFGEKLIEAVII
jgi:hypothetical protein